MSGQKLVGSERQEALSQIPQWKEAEGRDAIKRTFQFNDFKEAWAWMNKVADVADKDDHHPEWFNVYNKVDVLLATHTCNGVSDKDIKLAKTMDSFFQN
ncbi:transcriptional coactivator/pterin dehydratase [Planoprotostelium fungivorum]|uniref:4a-hydroxytetrahydrobiopterin dehydratase n=1 Tax=Planoprotostelium fungivorum TaxID=1890364 RepID=A0A2P6NQ16_9EUKA|nr:transcriptional coactivator/pterin dehydratase [Planoprotostelium fungivorum]